jgi:hypothetical protein
MLNLKPSAKSFSVMLFFLMLISCNHLSYEKQQPLIKLPITTINQLLSVGVSNMVFFNEEAEVVQVLDFIKDMPPSVRPLTHLIHVAAVKRENIIGDQILSLAKLPTDEVIGLYRNNISYIAFRDKKDQKIAVVELDEKGVCIPCMKAEAENQSIYPQSSLQINVVNSKSIVDFVLPAAQAACPKSCLTCSSKKCRSVLGSCCNCRPGT